MVLEGEKIEIKRKFEMDKQIKFENG